MQNPQKIFYSLFCVGRQCWPVCCGLKPADWDTGASAYGQGGEWHIGESEKDAPPPQKYSICGIASVNTVATTTGKLEGTSWGGWRSPPLFSSTPLVPRLLLLLHSCFTHSCLYSSFILPLNLARKSGDHCKLPIQYPAKKN